MFDGLKLTISDWLAGLRERLGVVGGWSRTLLIGLVVLTIILIGIGFYIDVKPERFDVYQTALKRAGDDPNRLVTGYVSTATLAHVAETLLDKNGGYLSNDITPPGVFMDNMPNWEYGVIVQIRDLSRVLRNDWSRSQTQSLEDPDLAKADPLFHFDHLSWMLPPTEREYRKGIKALDRYLSRLSDRAEPNAQFFARADNLREWLAIVEKRLGGLSQRLSASVGQSRVNTDLSGERQARQATTAPTEILVKTPWLQIDDVFFQARGTTWALIHFFEAVELDFADVLEDKNALVSVRQIRRELEASQQPVRSPMILNGGGFGLFPNHYLVLASYISRANAAVIDLRQLLEQG
jgi:hypothetical protein